MAAVSALDPIPKEEGLSLEPSPRSQRSEGTEDPERQSKHFEVRLCGLDVEKTGLVLMFLSALLFSIMGVFVKMAAESGMSPLQLVFMRAAGQGVFVLAGFYYCQLPTWYGERKERPWVIARGIMGGVGFVFYFCTIALLPLGDAITLASLYPAVTVVIARCTLGERMTWLKIAAIFFCSVGAVLVAKPTFIFGGSDENHPLAWVGYLTALGGSIIGGVLFVVIRKLKAAHFLQLVWSWVTFSVIISLILANTITQMTNPTPRQWFYCSCMIGFGTIGHFMLNYAARIAPAGPSSIVRSSDVLFAYIWEVIVFGESVSGLTIGGVAMIIIGIGIVGWSKWKSVRRQPGFVDLPTSDQLEAEIELKVQDLKRSNAVEIDNKETDYD
ncbi:hypothetical protein AAMO2058_000722200 [Amorphochlora amoebiformis]